MGHVGTLGRGDMGPWGHMGTRRHWAMGRRLGVIGDIGTMRRGAMGRRLGSRGVGGARGEWGQWGLGSMVPHGPHVPTSPPCPHIPPQRPHIPPLPPPTGALWGPPHNPQPPPHVRHSTPTPKSPNGSVVHPKWVRCHRVPPRGGPQCCCHRSVSPMSMLYGDPQSRSKEDCSCARRVGSVLGGDPVCCSTNAEPAVRWK